MTMTEEGCVSTVSVLDRGREPISGDGVVSELLHGKQELKSAIDPIVQRCSTIDNHDGSVNFGNVRERNGRNCGGGNSAYKVFDEMSSIKSIEQDGSVREYYDVFVSFANRVGWDDLCSISMFIWGLQPEIGTHVRLFKPNTLYGAYCLAIMQESTNKLLGQSCSKNVDLNSAGLDVVESNDENEVTDNTGLMGFAEASNENVNGKRMELRVCERDNNSKCVRVFDESCKEKMQDSSEIQEEKVYEDEEAAVTKEQIDLGRLIHGDDDMKVNTSENVVSEFMVVDIDKFEGCVNGDEMDYVPKRNTEQDEYIKGLGKENTRNDISLMEMTKMFEKRKGAEVKKIKKRHGFGAMDYGDSLFPILGLDGYSGADGTELLTLNQIMQALIQNFNMMTINFDITTIGYQNFTCGRFDVWKWPKKIRKEAKCKVKKRGWKFDFWKWLKRKNASGMYCLAKNKEWKFDIWRWPKRKKMGVKCGRLSKNKETLATYLTTYTSLKRLIQQISWMQWEATNTNTEDLVQWQDWIRRFLHLIWFTDTLMFLVDKKLKGDGMTKVELLDQCTIECLGGMEKETCDKMRNSVKKDGSGVHENEVMGCLGKKELVYYWKVNYLCSLPEYVICMAKELGLVKNKVSKVYGLQGFLDINVIIFYSTFSDERASKREELEILISWSHS
nr:hypothetical protein [Tanacetum cinerariifolium]